MSHLSDTQVRDVLVIGAGFAGLYAVYAARRAGLDVACLEAAGGIGGTWHFNQYPGCRCDVESIDYSYSFDEGLQNEWEWSERYATQPEILSYIHHVADRFDLNRHIQLHTDVVAARFDEARSLWHLETAGGEVHSAQYVIFATGSLSTPIKPNIPGIDEFAGHTLYTAQWPDNPPALEGKRVGVIGTGSSGIQSIPVIAESATSVSVFQRTANYSVPACNRTLTARDQARIRREYPERRKKSWVSGGGSPHQAHPQNAVDVAPEERERAFAEAWRMGGVLFSKAFPDQFTDIRANDYARAFFEAQVREIVHDPQTAEDLVPDDHPIGTKRICTDSGYYQTFNRDHVTLINLKREPISTITASGVTTSKASYDLDVLVLATGFDALTGPLSRIDLRGVDNTRIQDVWAAGPLTYLGMQIPNFPNLFLVNGPGSPSVLANMVLTSEQQIDWIIDLVRECRQRAVTQIEARHDAAEKWTDHVTELADKTLMPQANSWYTGANIDGKPRTFMLYTAGLGAFSAVCEQVKQNGYEGLIWTTR